MLEKRCGQKRRPASAAGPKGPGPGSRQGATLARGGEVSVTTTDLWRMSATDQAAAIRSGQASSREVIEAHLRRIDAVNPTVNAGGGERRMLEDRAGIITPVDPR